MTALERRINALERQAHGTEIDPFDLLKENGLPRTLAILEPSGRKTEADDLRAQMRRAREWVIEWERETFGKTLTRPNPLDKAFEDCLQ